MHLWMRRTLGPLLEGGKAAILHLTVNNNSPSKPHNKEKEEG